MIGEADAAIPMVGRRTRLRSPSQVFLDELYDLAITNAIPWQWQTAAETPETFRTSLWQGVLAQLAIAELRSNREVGLMTAYRANLQDGYTYLSMTLLPEFRLRGWPLEGAILFTNYLFVKFNLRKVYAETSDSFISQFKSGVGTAFELEGHFADRLIVNGKPQDLYVLATSRERWLETGGRQVQRIASRPRSAIQPS
jgi:RimJ/RimL family protein N-acetyltransferase